MNAREVAFAALTRCRRDGAWSGNALDSEIRRAMLSSRDAALASAICLGVIQNETLCDFYIDYFCTRKLEPQVRDILRIGVVQLLFMDRIPVSAAVNECVKLADHRVSGLVNAVLRKVAAQRDNLPEIPGRGSASFLSILYSHPQWLAERMIRDYGYEFTEQLFKADNTPAALSLHINTLKVSADEYKAMLKEQKIDFVSSELQPEMIEMQGGKVDALPGFADGLFYVQDRAAAAAVAGAEARPGMKVLDVCSAPGGKSFAAAIAMQNQGRILSCDIHEKKLERIRSGAERLGITIIETKARDARDEDETMNGQYDLVIADVPCSGFGVIRKKPEIRRKDPTQLVHLPDIQLAILNSASMFVTDGGTLLYSTCTVLREENEEVVTRFLRDNDDFVLEPFTEAPDGMKTFWPHIDHTDGFFAARMKKTGKKIS